MMKDDILNKQQEDKTGEKVKIQRLVETSCSWDKVKLPDYPVTAPKVTAIRYTIPPHTKLGRHSHPTINFGIMLSGQLTVVKDNGESKTFHEGDVIVETVNNIHYGENRGDIPAELIMFYAGTEGLPLKEEAF